MFDTGNTGFMLVATSLVMLMTPGLAFFYGGLVGRKNVLAIMLQSFVSLGWTTALWFICGYSLCFSGDLGGGDRQPGPRFLERRLSHGRLWHQRDSIAGFHCLPDDVRHHHAGSDHRRFHK